MDCSTFSFDLHVLGTPPALILSQDQTLVCNLLSRDGGRETVYRQNLSINLICVRPLEMNLKHPSHDWHVQPVVKDRMALLRAGRRLRRNDGAVMHRLSSKPVRNIAGEAPAEFAARDPSGATRHPREKAMD
jgi:hypothetical protein